MKLLLWGNDKSSDMGSPAQCVLWYKKALSHGFICTVKLLSTTHMKRNGWQTCFIFSKCWVQFSAQRLDIL